MTVGQFRSAGRGFFSGRSGRCVSRSVICPVSTVNARYRSERPRELAVLLWHSVRGFRRSRRRNLLHEINAFHVLETVLSTVEVRCTGQSSRDSVEADFASFAAGNLEIRRSREWNAVCSLLGERGMVDREAED